MIQSAAVQPLAVKRAVTPNSPSVVMAARGCSQLVVQRLYCLTETAVQAGCETVDQPAWGRVPKWGAFNKIGRCDVPSPAVF